MYDLDTIHTINVKAEAKENAKNTSSRKTMKPVAKLIDGLKCQAEKMRAMEYLRQTYLEIHNNEAHEARQTAQEVQKVENWYTGQNTRLIAARV